MFLFENDVDLLVELGSSINGINRIFLKVKGILYEQCQDDLSYIKNEEVSVIEGI